MSIQIANSEQAQKAMSYVNSHQTNADKFFGRLSTGLKIISASDNSSAWAMSERMRGLIRSFSQDHQNLQNDSALTRTAERGIDQIVQNLRTLKEIAIDSANDSNNDWDRNVLQKEVDQRLQILDDIARGTKYNGKILLDGTYRIPVFNTDNTTIGNVLGSISAAYNATTSSQSTNGGTLKDWKFTIDLGFEKATSNGTWSWAKEWFGSIPTNSKQTNQFAAYLDFSSMTATDDYPKTLHNQGFSILCSGCAQFINIIFDANKSADESTYGRPHGAETNDKAREFVIGVKDVQSGADLAEAILEGVYANRGRIANTGNYDASTADNALLDTNHQLRIARDPADPSKILILKDSLALQFRSNAIRKPIIGNPLWVQHGTQAGQRFNLYINSVTKTALGLDNLSVRTRQDAQSAIGTIDYAIEYALGEATNMGAYLQRLEVTDLNVTTQDENAQATESAIRDADMAKEMINYTKHNFLLQSSQAMLAQANQNSEEVVNFMQ